MVSNVVARKIQFDTFEPRLHLDLYLGHLLRSLIGSRQKILPCKYFLHGNSGVPFLARDLPRRDISLTEMKFNLASILFSG